MLSIGNPTKTLMIKVNKGGKYTSDKFEHGSVSNESIGYVSDHLLRTNFKSNQNKEETKAQNEYATTDIRDVMDRRREIKKAHNSEQIVVEKKIPKYMKRRDEIANFINQFQHLPENQERCRNPHFNCGPRKNFCTPIPRKACETDCSENFYKNEKIRGKSAFRKVSKDSKVFNPRVGFKSDGPSMLSYGSTRHHNLNKLPSLLEDSELTNKMVMDIFKILQKENCTSGADLKKIHEKITRLPSWQEATTNQITSLRESNKEEFAKMQEDYIKLMNKRFDKLEELNKTLVNKLENQIIVAKPEDSTNLINKIHKVEIKDDIKEETKSLNSHTSRKLSVDELSMKNVQEASNQSDAGTKARKAFESVVKSKNKEEIKLDLNNVKHNDEEDSLKTSYRESEDEKNSDKEKDKISVIQSTQKEVKLEAQTKNIQTLNPFSNINTSNQKPQANSPNFKQESSKKTENNAQLKNNPFAKDNKPIQRASNLFERKGNNPPPATSNKFGGGSLSTITEESSMDTDNSKQFGGIISKNNPSKFNTQNSRDNNQSNALSNPFTRRTNQTNAFAQRENSSRESNSRDRNPFESNRSSTRFNAAQSRDGGSRDSLFSMGGSTKNTNTNDGLFQLNKRGR